MVLPVLATSSNRIIFLPEREPISVDTSICLFNGLPGSSFIEKKFIVSGLVFISSAPTIFANCTPFLFIPAKYISLSSR